MIDDIIAYSFDSEGNQIPISLGDIYRECAEMIRLMYFDYMIKCHSYNPVPNVDIFKECHQKIFDKMINDVHNMYVDHIEGVRRSIAESIVRKNGEING